MQHILSENTLTVIMDNGMPRSLHRGACGEEAWARALHAVHNDDYETIEDILDKPRGINRYFEEHGIQVVDGVLRYGDKELNSYAATKAIQFVEQGLPAGALINFLKRVEQNPSYRAVQDLYKFLEFNGMPLTPEGHFMAYKKVRRVCETRPPMSGAVYQFVDIYTQQICNDPGENVWMPRNQVDENPDRTCSRGLHVCSYDYLPKFGRENGDTVVMVSVDPADVVAIPHEYDNAKMRVCAYKVVREIPEWRGHTWDSGVVEEHPNHEEMEDDEPDDDEFGVQQEEDYLGTTVKQLLDELNNASGEGKDRFHERVIFVARALDQIPPLSTEMRMRFLLKNDHTPDQIRARFCG